MVIYRDQWVFLDYLPLTDALNGIITSLLVAGSSLLELVRVGFHGNRVGFTSNSETHMTVTCDARLIYGRGQTSPGLAVGL